MFEKARGETNIIYRAQFGSIAGHSILCNLKLCRCQFSHLLNHLHGIG